MHYNITAGDRQIALIQGTQCNHGGTCDFYNHGDWLNTSRMLTFPDGTVWQKNVSLPFGDMLSYNNPTCCDFNWFHFTGKWHDWAIHLDYFAARFYNSSFWKMNVTRLE